MPLSRDQVKTAIHVAAPLLAFTKRDVIVKRRGEAVTDVPCRSGIGRGEIGWIRRAEVGGAAERGSAVGEGVAPDVGSEELESIRVAFFEFHGGRGVVAIAE